MRGSPQQLDECCGRRRECACIGGCKHVYTIVYSTRFATSPPNNKITTYTAAFPPGRALSFRSVRHALRPSLKSSTLRSLEILCEPNPNLFKQNPTPNHPENVLVVVVHRKPSDEWRNATHQADLMLASTVVPKEGVRTRRPSDTDGIQQAQGASTKGWWLALKGRLRSHPVSAGGSAANKFSFEAVRWPIPPST